mmetsp:Transcript_12886/g.21056  ORF Transcript_12886/g.21056 Transcript_12886/m.21056 type:complete len:355 (+) Transcript_12886:169-1233(+)|eukprot:CAMPEP_0184647648 /NCGR_PEP_ID=MMETSP0308-20130426/4633_1 /TAXON_ID=38269 /ORGANISM="Gloeochaete witrockiana, Strain SAG 46.84" /LENGTH=354 /DNA_ID=CAMNT_0027078819 /DNA_START=87 /DNA_END=1151 /DNA_ORIENTATION=-
MGEPATLLLPPSSSALPSCSSPKRARITCESLRAPSPDPTCVELVVTWNRNSFSFSVPVHTTVGVVKALLYSRTNVLPKRQKLVGFSLAGRPAGDEVPISSLNLKKNQKVMMIGTPEEDIPLPPEDLPEVLMDFDMDYAAENTDIRLRPENRLKLQKRIETIEVRVMNAPRPGKKLCVLDLDYTLFDCKGLASNIQELKRPFLDEFMAMVYSEYDIIVWSQTSWKWLEMKLTELGLLTSTQFHIAFVLDRTSMFEVVNKDRTHEVKPLELIWAKFPNTYNSKNTIHIDDLGRNFAMNPQNGLKITPFRKAHTSARQDRELYLLSQYLILISELKDFSTLDHSKWKQYLGDRGLT